MKKRGLVEAKTVTIILGVLVLAALLILIFQFDLFGYIKNLPSFGEVKEGDVEVAFDDLLINARCENYVGAISDDKVPVSWWKKTFLSGGKDIRFFYFIQMVDGKPIAKPSKQFVVVMEPQPPRVFFIAEKGIFYDDDVVLGIFDAEEKVFKVTEEFKTFDICNEDMFMKDVSFYQDDKFGEKAAEKFEDFGGCNFLQQLHGAEIRRSRVLCKDSEQLKKEEKTQTSDITKIITNLDSLTKMLDDKSRVLVELGDPFCANAKSNFIKLGVENNNNPFEGKTKMYLGWDAKARQGIGQAFLTFDKRKVYFKDDVEKHRENSEEFFSIAQDTKEGVEKQNDFDASESDFNDIIDILGGDNFYNFQQRLWNVARKNSNILLDLNDKEVDVFSRDNIKLVLTSNRPRYIEKWIDEKVCFKEEAKKIYGCYFDENGDYDVEAKSCELVENNFCLIGVTDNSCGKGCLCQKNYDQEGYEFYISKENTKIHYLINEEVLVIV